MMEKRILVMICLLFFITAGQSQSKKSKEVGINMTDLITQLIPFKGSTAVSGPFAIMWRSGTDGKFFNIQLGARITDNGFNTNYANVQIGYLRKRELGDKMSYFTSQNFILTGGGLNIPNQELDQDGSMGFSFGAGLQYEISDHLAVATETLLVIAFGNSGGANFVPPVGIFLLAKF